MICPYCGKKNTGEEAVCRYCKAALHKPEKEKANKKSKGENKDGT